MQIKRKDIKKDSWNRVLKHKFAFTEITEKKGVVALSFLEKVSVPLKRFCFGKEITLADNGYYWLQIGFEGENYWITALYNENKKFLQYYFDITLENNICGDKSYFLDLFLDVIVQSKGECKILDKEELDSALKCGLISSEQYDMAVSVAKGIVSVIEENREKLDDFCQKYFQMLVEKLK